MNRTIQILLMCVAMLLGVCCGSIVSIADAVAQVPDQYKDEFRPIEEAPGSPLIRVVKFPILIPNPAAAGTASCDPNWRNGSANPCKIPMYGVTGVKFMGGCSYYTWGDNKATFDPGSAEPNKMKPYTFWKDTIVNVEIFKALKFPTADLIAQRATPTEGGLVTGVKLIDGGTIDVVLGQPLPEGVIIPMLTPYTGLTNRLVQCIRETILQIVVGEELKTFVEPVYKVTILLVSIAIILYSYDVILNKHLARKPGTWIAKSCLIAGVLAFTSENGVKQYVNFFLTAQDELVGLASGAFRVDPTGGNAANDQGFGSFCNQSEAKYYLKDDTAADPDDKQKRPYGTWEKVDCIIASLMGMTILKPDDTKVDFGDLASDPFSPQSLGPKEFLTIVPAAIFLGELWTSMGPWILVMGGIVILTMIAAFMQAMLIYIVSVIVVVFLAILGPIVIPMALFDSTRHGFKGWVQMLFAYSIQPAVIMAYLTFMLFILDISLYGRAPLTKEEEETRVELEDKKKAGTTLTAAEMEQLTKYTFPKDGSLMWFYLQGKQAGKKNFKDTDIFHIHSQTQDTNVSDGGNAQTATSGKQQSAVSQIKFCWKAPCDSTNLPYNNRENLRLLQSLVVTALLLGLTLSFMTNVMNFGAQIAGLEADSKMMALNVYNEMMDKVSQATQGHLTR